jgi:ribosomal protein S18 acetylase RimI-like enzyme
MTARIRPMCAEDLEGIVRLSLAAFEPIFASFRRVLGAEIYERIYPDWTTSQAAAVESVCRDSRNTVWVAAVDELSVGFIAYDLKPETKVAEIQMLAVDPEYQNQGIGTQLNAFALDRMAESGITLAEVGTGGDPGHAPARRTYEKAGYTALPLVRYYKEVGPDIR